MTDSKRGFVTTLIESLEENYQQAVSNPAVKAAGHAVKVLNILDAVKNLLVVLDDSTEAITLEEQVALDKVEAELFSFSAGLGGSGAIALAAGQGAGVSLAGLGATGTAVAGATLLVTVGVVVGTGLLYKAAYDALENVGFGFFSENISYADLPVDELEIFGSIQDDVIQGRVTKDFIFSGTGDDTIIASGGSDVVIAFTGTDTVNYSGFGERIVVTASEIEAGSILGIDVGVDIEVDYGSETDARHILKACGLRLS